MVFLRVILVFYGKLIVPSLAASIAVGIIGLGVPLPFTKVFGASLILFGPVFHYLIYEIRDKKEYYFYFNIGLNKSVLWGATCAISSIIGFVILQF